MNPPRGTRVIVGLSGGVDSAVAALLAMRAGYDVQGLFMSNWDEDDAYCTTAQDFQDARAVARELGIPLHRVNFAAQYREQVFANFLAEHRAGRTPNPDVLCNREIKFGVCLEHARRLGGDCLATGHYARLVAGDNGPQLHKARDDNKDQSYFLHAVKRAEFTRAWFPLGDLDKPEVRALARAAGLPVHDKPDSTGICFIGERPFREFLERWLPHEPGPIVTDDGEAIGTHRGLAYYTLGQRSGIEVGGRAGRDAAPWYVAAKDGARRRLVVVQRNDHPLLMSAALTTERVNWLASAPTAASYAAVKVRYRQADVPARVTPAADGMRIEFTRPERAVTPGQSAVVYAGSRCLGGAVIAQTTPLAHTAAEALGSDGVCAYNGRLFGTDRAPH